MSTPMPPMMTPTKPLPEQMGPKTLEEWQECARKWRAAWLDEFTRRTKLQGELIAANADKERINFLAAQWDSQGKGHHICGRWIPNVTGSFRDALDAARHPGREETNL